jgi:hypothetical protein
VVDAELVGPCDTWQLLVGSSVDESFLDMCHLDGEWIGDTWPKQGLPRVTWTMV